MWRVLQGADAALAVQLRDGDGEPVEPDGNVDVAVVDSSGEPVAGSPFTGTADGQLLTFTLPAAITATLDTYTATASDEVDGATAVARLPIEVVSGFLCQIAELRAKDPLLDDAGNYPLTYMRAVRIATEQRMERAARRFWTRRARRITVRTDRAGRIDVPDIDIDRIRTVTVDGATVDAAGVHLTGGDNGFLVPTNSWWECDVPATVLYESGLDVVPAPVAEAAMKLARDVAVRSMTPSRATAETTELGTFRFTIAGRDGTTGLPEVDEVIREFGRRGPALG